MAIEPIGRSSDCSETCLLEKSPELDIFDAAQSQGWIRLLISLGNFVLFALTCMIWIWLSTTSRDRNQSYRDTSFYSPIFDKGINMDLDMSSMNATLWGIDETTSIYIQDPSPEVDAAWDRISADTGHIITINSDEARKLGRDPNIIVKAPESWGFGDDAYPAQIDVFHEIHCLDVLRKEMYWDYYFRPQYGEPSNADYLQVRHKKHCLRIVLRTLMCNADVDIVTHNWRRGSFRPISDFDNPRKCRNFEELLDWNMQHAVPDDMGKWETIKRPTDAVILPKPTPNIYTSEDSYEWLNNV